ncbi:MAG: HAD family hydrolase [Dehalococcoidales bacterium]|nr:HAD family hydrolase [Dehalococcoidales bacterium]
MNPPIVFLDMGGTLVDSPDLFEAISARLVGCASDKKTCQTVMTTFIQVFRERDSIIPFLNVEGMMARILSVLAEKHGYKDISSQAHDIVFEVYLDKAALFPEVIPVLDRLLENDVKMVIASDADTHLMDEELKKFRLEKYFCDICVSDSVKAYKPTAGFTGYLKKYTLGNEKDCYFVGDSQVDVESAGRLGIKSVLVDRNKSGRNYQADYVFSDLTALPPALRI